MSDIKAIETRYRGYRFRSRLEARWAVFFDAMKIEWEYEPEGYPTDEGGYLPDFRLFGGLFAEVKAAVRLEESMPKMVAFVLGTGFDLLILPNVPDVEWYQVLSQERGGISIDWLDFSMSAYKQRPWLAFCGSLKPEKEDLDRSSEFAFAVEAARSARFEHGETPR